MTEVTIREQMMRMTSRAMAIPFQFLCGGALPTSVAPAGSSHFETPPSGSCGAEPYSLRTNDDIIRLENYSIEALPAAETISFGDAKAESVKLPYGGMDVYTQKDL
ncbi:hypothetical protein EYF80_044905 [Liparis tanakae]|uniref:Uncharacterized protein n=1 Tax=Liparis tanakae TaxID=230148 RepID=A0A4Z2FVI9_9TELE|nr:hypothetical protein EYF80_044905 [Liparis tanakae]